jgi:hypothetical protein
MLLKLSLALFCLQSFSIPVNLENTSLTEKTIQNHFEKSIKIPKVLKVVVDNNRAILKLIAPNNVKLASITIYNLQGKKVLKRRRIVVRRQREVSTKNINNGIYIIEIVLEDRQVITKKVVIKN